jgi:hypothetical protein
MDNRAEIGKKIKIELADMDLPSWKRDLETDLTVIENLLSSIDLLALMSYN